MFHRRAATTTGALVVVLGLALACGDALRLSEAPARGWLPVLPVLVAGLVLLAAGRAGGAWASTALALVGLVSVVAAVLRIVLLDQTPGTAAALVSPLTVATCGTVLLGLGTYGRVSGCLPADNPYRRAGRGGTAWPAPVAGRTPRPSLDELAAAEQAMAEGHPTFDQEHLLLLHSPAACRARRVLDARRRRFPTRGGGGQHAHKRTRRDRPWRLPPH